LPVDGLYVYFRYDDKQTVMCVINTSKKQESINLSDYTERTAGFSSAMNVMDGTSSNASSVINIDPQQSLVLELKKIE